MNNNTDTEEEKPLFPMRINKYMARDRNCSRREADEIIRAKRVYINGRLAVLGDKVMEEDKVEVRFHSAKGNTNGPAFAKSSGTAKRESKPSSV